MGILIDTSVWIDHFRQRNDVLAELLELHLALTHPIMLVELTCGTPPAPRVQTLNDSGLLKQTQETCLREVIGFIEHEKLYGLGCGLVDMVLLASTMMTPAAQLWTLDKRLIALARRFGVMHQPALR